MFKKSLLVKTVVSAAALTLAFGTISPGFVAKAEEKKVTSDQQLVVPVEVEESFYVEDFGSRDVFPDAEGMYDEEAYQEFYNENIMSNPNFNAELLELRSQFNQQLNGTTGAAEGQFTTQGAFGHGLKAISAIGNMVKHGGRALSWALKPFSANTAKVVKKNSNKIGKAFKKPEKATRSYLIKRLMDAGVSRKDAETIVYWVFMIL
ncbi:hypothetical protein [Terribacillus saccharophilus]|uniref:hypothetical protein n=1 Tax=Terribacillus saccharophilus TaxID=361277 RepID=UPI000BA79E39|nr:hypothetical protein [Terribacillus saccharophilus]PAF18108.1 hypothetical protein CHH51_09710 [Terribacillus saccharophilus]